MRRKPSDWSPHTFEFLKGGVGYFLPHRSERPLVGSGNQKAVPGPDDALGNGGDLVGGLALAEDNLRKTLPQAALMVDAGKTQVFERGLA
jgi:hypothetical protein